VNVVTVLIAVEGMDHSGKTTLTGSLASALRPAWRVRTCREPSHGPIGTVFRRLSATGATSAMAMALLSAADRHAEQVQLQRHLADCDVLLADRYYLSGLAYHHADGVDPTLYQRIAGDVRRPDAYLFLEVDAATAAARVCGPPDSVWEQRVFAARLPGSYERCLDLIIATEGAYVMRIDAARPVEDVHAVAIAAVSGLLAGISGRTTT